MMSRMTFKTLNVERYKGIKPEDNLHYTGDHAFCDGLTAIVGANGAGKSTTAKGLCEFIWPDASSSGHMEATVRVGENLQQGEFTSGRVQWKRTEEGEASVELIAPPPEFKECYHLDLEELIQGKTGNLTEKIQLEIDGGLNISEAAQKLDFDSKPSGLRDLPKNIRHLHGNLIDALRGQQTYADTERELEETSQSIQQAQQYQARLEHLDTILDYRKKSQLKTDAKTARDGYGKTVFSLREEDCETLLGFWAEQDNAEKELQDAREKIERIRADGLCKTAISKQDVECAQAYLETLQGLRTKLEGAEEEYSSAQTTCSTTRQQIGQAVTDECLEQLTTAPDLPKDLRDAVSEIGRLQSEYTALEAQKDRLDSAFTDAVTSSVESLAGGITELRKWLRLPVEGVQKSHDWVTVMLAAAGCVISTIIALITSPLVWLFTPIFLIVLIWGFSRSFGQQVTDVASQRSGIRSDYEATGIEPPADWTDDAVARRLHELEETMTKAKLREKGDTWKQEIEQRIRRTKDDMDKRTESLKEICTQWGIGDDISPQGLLHLVDRLNDWRGKKLALAEAEGKFEHAEKNWQDTMGKLAGCIHTFFPDLNMETLQEARTAVKRLSDDCNNQARIRELEDEIIPGYNTRIEKGKEATGRILDRLDMTECSRDEVLDKLQNLEQVKAAAEATKAEADQAKRDFELAKTRYDSLPREIREKFEEAEDQTLQELQTRYQEEVNGLAKLHESRGKLKEKLDALSAGDSIEDAQANLEGAREEAAMKCNMQADRLIGQMCVDHIRTRGDIRRSEKLKLARDYLASFTNDRYRLDMSVSGGSFSIWDATKGRGQTMDELSSGTKIQLLIASRLAFIDSLERSTGMKLPVFLDEVLCNTDDERAENIIKAIAAIAGQERQVFYFTAQYDEIGKLQAYAERDDGFTLHCISLPLSGEPVEPIQVIHPPKPAVPEGSEDDTWQSYMRRLGQEPFSPYQLVDSSDSLHLGWLIHDPHAVYALLVKGYERWGHLHGLYERGGIQAVNYLASQVTEELFEKAKLRARCFEILANEWCRGRGRPVDPDKITGGAKFEEKAKKLARECNYNAELMVDNADGVKRFNVEKLKEILQEQGALASEEERSSRSTNADLRAALDAFLATNKNTHDKGNIVDTLKRDWMISLFPCDSTENSIDVPSNY
jgi:exonuclease SbcC